MPLVKATFTANLQKKFYDILMEQAKKATEGDEQEEPKDVIKVISDALGKAVADEVDTYIKSGDIIVGPAQVGVTSTAPGTPATVAPLQPAKIK